MVISQANFIDSLCTYLYLTIRSIILSIRRIANGSWTFVHLSSPISPMQIYLFFHIYFYLSIQWLLSTLKAHSKRVLDMDIRDGNLWAVVIVELGQQASWLLIGYTRVNLTNQKPDQQDDPTLDMTTRLQNFRPWGWICICGSYCAGPCHRWCCKQTKGSMGPDWIRDFRRRLRGKWRGYFLQFFR